MSARKILLGAHVEIVVFNGVQHGIDALDTGNLDGAGGQSHVCVRIVGGVRL